MPRASRSRHLDAGAAGLQQWGGLGVQLQRVRPGHRTLDDRRHHWRGVPAIFRQRLRPRPLRRIITKLIIWFIENAK